MPKAAGRDSGRERAAVAEPAPSRWVPALVLLAVLMLCLAGWWWFPALQGWMATQDCIASGHTNCR